MTSLRLLHSSDWHIGMTRRHLAESRRSVFLNSRLDAIERLCDLALEEEVDGVVVAGDVFDGAQLAPGIVVPLLELLGDLSCPVVLVPGNHDSYQYESVYRSTAFLENMPDNLTVATEPTVLSVIPNCELVVGTFTDRFPTRNPLFVAAEQLPQDKPADGFRVAVGHASVDAYAPSMGDTDGAIVVPVESLEQLVQDYSLDYVALGDRHSTVQVGQTGRIWYSGSPEVTDFDDVEDDSGNALLLTLGKDEPQVDKRKVGQWGFRTIHATVHNAQELNDLDKQLRALPKKNKLSVRVGLKAYLPLSVMGELEKLLDQWENLFAGFRLWERHSELNTLAENAELDDFVSGYVKDGADKLLTQAEAGDDVSRDALLLLHRLATEKGD